MKKTFALSLAIATIALGLAPAAMAADAAAANPIGVTTGFSFTRNLVEGSTGDDVKQLQIFLNKTPATAVAVAPHAGSAGHETAAFGPATTKAVMAYQTANGIEATGLVGPLTRASLNAALSGATVVTIGLPPVVSSFTADTSTPGSAILTVNYDGSTEKPTIWFAYGATPSSLSILSSKVASEKIVGASQVSLSNLGTGDCYAQAYVQNSVGTTSSAVVHCAK